mgnify:CR=1 FL=1
MDVFGVVYLIRNLVNGKRYVGQTKKTVKERFAEHARCKTSLIGKAIHKYDKKKFCYGIIKTCATREELNYWEIHFIAALKSKVPYGYNLTDGGEGLSGYVVSDETREKRSIKLRGIPKSPEQCAAIAATLQGRFCGEDNPFFGKHHSLLTCSELSIKKRKESPYKNLLAEMDKLQMSYHALAKLLGVTQSAVSRKILCDNNFSDNDNAKLEEIFGLPAEYLLYCEIPPKPPKMRKKTSSYKNLIAEMDARQLSYVALEKLMDSPKNTLAPKMRGERSFTIKDRIKLIEIFQKPLEYLLKREED